MWPALSCWFVVLWNCIKIYVIGGITMVSEILTKIRYPRDLPRREGDVAVVTGGTGGIGYATVKGLLEHGMTVIIGGRNESQGRQVVQEFKSEFPSCNVEFWCLDLASLDSVRQFAERFIERKLPLHLLVNNAGIMMTPYTTTKEGFESQIGVNYMSHFLFTMLLLDVMKKTGSTNHYARIVNVSSAVHKVAAPDLSDFTKRDCYSSHGAYAWSKLAVILFTYELQQNLSADGVNVTANTLHPGVVDTQLYRNLHWFLKFATGYLNRLFKTPTQGAYTSLYLALSNQVEGQGGHYYDNCQQTPSSTLSHSRKLQQELWTKTYDLVMLS